MPGINVQPCCCDAIAFAYGYIPVGFRQCFPPYFKYITNLGSNINLLTSEVRLIFLGRDASCDNGGGCDNIFVATNCGTLMPKATWPRLKQWIMDGGRCYVAGEFRLKNNPTQSCLSASGKTNINQFMLFMGSGMFLEDFDNCDNTCIDITTTPQTGWNGTSNFTSGLMQGMPEFGGRINDIWHADTNCIMVNTGIEMSATNPVIAGADCITGPGDSFIGIQAIGKGYIVLAGDSNITSGCAGIKNIPLSYNCKLWQTYYYKQGNLA